MAHQDWVFALSWLDDEFLVSGSRDTSLSLWRVPDESPLTYPEQKIHSSSSIHRRNSATSSSSISLPPLSSSQSSSSSYSGTEIVPSYSYINAVATRECRSAQKVRDIVFNRKLQEIACVSLNGYIHIWSAERFTQVRQDNEQDKLLLQELFMHTSFILVIFLEIFSQAPIQHGERLPRCT